MSDRPTPETDAETNYCDAMPNMPWVDAEVSRHLERERDEAREERDIARLEFEEISNDLKDARNRIWQLEKQIEGLNNFANERYEEIQKVRKERDEAREMVSELKLIRSDYCDEQLRLVFENRRLHQEHDEAYLRLREAIIATLEENRHLADGDDCTLTKLKSVVPDWK